MYRTRKMLSQSTGDLTTVKKGKEMEEASVRIQRLPITTTKEFTVKVAKKE